MLESFHTFSFWELLKRIRFTHFTFAQIHVFLLFSLTFSSPPSLHCVFFRFTQLFHFLQFFSSPSFSSLLDFALLSYASLSVPDFDSLDLASLFPPSPLLHTVFSRRLVLFCFTHIFFTPLFFLHHSNPLLSVSLFSGWALLTTRGNSSEPLVQQAACFNTVENELRN